MLIRATKYSLEPCRINVGTRGSYGIEKLEFDLSCEWDGLSVSVIFYPKRGKPIKVPYLGGEIDIPPEVMKFSGEAQFILSGVIAAAGEIERKIISLDGTLDIMHTLDDKGGNAGKVTSDTYDLFLSEAEKYINNTLSKAKESGEFKGEKGPQGEKGDPGEKGETGDSGVYVSESEADEPKGDENVWIIDDGNEDNDEDINIPDGFTYVNNILRLMCGGMPVGDPVEVISGGRDGEDGFSPVVSVTPTSVGVSISITDKNGTQVFAISNGKNFRILGYYDTLEELRAAVPNPEVGDAYGVGTKAPYNAYVFDGVINDWRDNGSLAGVAGEDGYSPSASVVKNGSMSTITITDKSGTTTAEILDGKNGVGINGAVLNADYTLTISFTDGTTYTTPSIRGEKGDTGNSAVFTMDSEMSNTSENPVKNMVIKAYIDGLIGDIDTAVSKINGILGGNAV